MTDRPYTPIDCGLVDELQLRSMRGQTVLVVWHEGDETRQVEAPIRDVRTQDGAEFILLPEDQLIRLDDLVSVDGITFGKNC